MNDFGAIIADGYRRGFECEGCGQPYQPHPDPSTEAEAKLCPKCLQEEDRAMSNPIFPYDAKRAQALANHFDCPLEEIKVVEGMGINVYTWVEEGMTQEEGEEQNGCWTIFNSDEFDPAAEEHVKQSLHTYHDHALIEASEVNGIPDSFKLMMRRAVQCWIGKKAEEKPPSIREALECLLDKKIKKLKDWENEYEIMALADLPSEAKDLVVLALHPEPNSDRLRLALEKVVDVDKLIEIHHSESGWEGVFDAADYAEVEVDGEEYHLLQHQ